MYTRIPPYREESRKEEEERISLPEHYGGVAFSQAEDAHTEPQKDSDEQVREEESIPVGGKESRAKEKVNPFSFLSRKGDSGREDMLLLVLALLLLGGEDGDESLALMLLALLFLG